MNTQKTPALQAKAKPKAEADNPNHKLDYSGYHKNRIQ